MTAKPDASKTASSVSPSRAAAQVRSPAPESSSGVSVPAANSAAPAESLLPARSNVSRTESGTDSRDPLLSAKPTGDAAEAVKNNQPEAIRVAESSVPGRSSGVTVLPPAAPDSSANAGAVRTIPPFGAVLPAAPPDSSAGPQGRASDDGVALISSHPADASSSTPPTAATVPETPTRPAQIEFSAE